MRTECFPVAGLWCQAGRASRPVQLFFQAVGGKRRWKYLMRRFDEPGEKCPLVILKSSDHDNWRMCRDSSGFQMAGLLTVNNLNWGSFYLPLFEKAVNHSANFCYRNQHVANGSFEGYCRQAAFRMPRVVNDRFTAHCGPSQRGNFKMRMGGNFQTRRGGRFEMRMGGNVRANTHNRSLLGC